MKTKEFIKMLQEEDPSGEGYLRVQGGAIYGVESKAGYWDGNYSYYDKDTEILHITSDNYKIDVLTISPEDIVWYENGNMDEIKKRLDPNYECYSDPKQRKEMYGNFWKRIEKEAVDARECYEKLHQESLKRVMERYKNGWKARIIKDHKNIWEIKWIKFMKKDTLNQGEIGIVTDTNIFDKIEKGKYIYYKLK